MPFGKIKFYDSQRGYGFIVPDGEFLAKNVFFHKLTFVDMPQTGILEPREPVEYEIDEARVDPRGPRACIVRRLTDGD
jgi:cold shock CspA family protein